MAQKSVGWRNHKPAPSDCDESISLPQSHCRNLPSCMPGDCAAGLRSANSAPAKNPAVRQRFQGDTQARRSAFEIIQGTVTLSLFGNCGSRIMIGRTIFEHGIDNPG